MGSYVERILGLSFGRPFLVSEDYVSGTVFEHLADLDRGDPARCHEDDNTERTYMEMIRFVIFCLIKKTIAEKS